MMSSFQELVADEKGASSVLVIFMMIVLVTLGAFAITSANVNYKFSLRAHDWNAMYYSLDAKGEEYLSALDGKLAEAEAAACDYVENRSYRTVEQTEISEQLQTAIYNEYRNNPGNNFTGDVFNKVYMYYADQYLTDLTQTYSGFETYPVADETTISSILAQINLKSEQQGNERCGLNITIWIEPVAYETAGTDGSFSMVRTNNNLRYKIEDWYEYQEHDTKESEPEVWDGSL